MAKTVHALCRQVTAAHIARNLSLLVHCKVPVNPSSAPI